MAQAARLNLRMQRELKLLLSDPPPGAAFPSLSSSAAPPLSSIDAQIEGPEGTVYANGIFKLKIQIPDRYPFQPPVVTFVTPIYHPNIDNGGRICLDILNLPPKGAWQPSLNISTVITSIGLLLSEPNPDDGLMHDASEEYKYNRQVFDQKARSMTEKFARAQSSEDVGSVSAQEVLTRINPEAEKVDDKGSDASKSNAIQCFLSQNRPSRVIRKLSLDSSGSKQNCDSTEGVTGLPLPCLSNNQLESGDLKPCRDNPKEVNEISGQIEAGGSKQNRNAPKRVNEIPNNQIEAGVLKHNRKVSGEFDSVPENQIEEGCLSKEAVGLPGEYKKLRRTKQNASSEFLSPSGARNSYKKDDPIPDQCPSHLEARSTNTKPLANLNGPEPVKNSADLSLKRKQTLQCHDLKQNSGNQLPETTSCDHMDIKDTNLNSFSTTKHKKLGLAGRKMSLGPFRSSQGLQNNKENSVSVPSFPHSKVKLHSKPSLAYAMSETSDSSATIVDKKPGESLQRRPLQPLVHHQSNSCYLQSETNIKEEELESPITEAVIVLDSEDSEDEKNLPVRSKLSLSRKCLPGKRKAKA